jgi:hypothetical protein
MSFPIRKIGLLEMPKIAMLSTNRQPRKFIYVLKVPFSKRRENHVVFNPENWNAQNAENCDAVYNFIRNVGC